MKRFLQGNWDQIRRKLKEKYEELNDEDLKYVEGHEEELMSKLQVKLDKTKREMTSELKTIITN
ncbi:CsbD family protein [Roseivirga echinicomitans]|uniref:General stress protein CsbD n=1 Tax=Roseivirga echinicomitans TaxID=296218 RepID=A0A150XXQ0_9BACT|nr:general stress protein CsbD [Roseivirga echinicomitans]KYG83424.1 general stress protein CsbD [Roseivirga echinicomitans]